MVNFSYDQSFFIRVCVDIRLLNKYLIEDDKFEIRRIPDILAAFRGAKLFDEFDLKEVYNQFKIQVYFALAGFLNTSYITYI